MIPGLKFGQDYYDDLLAKYTHKKELFLKGLDDLHIIHNDPEGAYSEQCPAPASSASR